MNCLMIVNFLEAKEEKQEECEEKNGEDEGQTDKEIELCQIITEEDALGK